MADVVSRRVTSKPGRPSLQKVAALEGIILDAACGLFLEQGYANATMANVAIAAGISKGTLYSRYADKSELFNAVLDERLKFWAEQTPEVASEPSVTLAERMFRFGSKFLERMRDPEIAAFHYLLSAEAGRFPELGKKLMEFGQGGAIERLMRELEGASGDWKITDVESVGRAFVASLIGWFHTEARLRRLGPAECDAFVSRLVAIFVGGRASW